ncbi:MAG TPA: hypothetical protein VMH01_16280 [Puia sp.]|nr:hypothetical protein [Puia sp.]
MGSHHPSGRPSRLIIYVKSLVLIAYFLCLLPICIFSFKRPYYNWDMLAYMGVVLYHDQDNAQLIHDKVYTIAKEEIPAKEYTLLTDSSVEYRQRLEKNAASFYNQLPFYVVKPLYTKSIYLLNKSGYSLIHSIILLSILPFLLIGALLFLWLQKYLPILVAFAASLLIMYSAPMIDVIRTSSPDCLSALFLFGAFYFLIEKKPLTVAFGLLLLSVFTRLDNIVPSFFILTMLLFTNKIKISPGKYALALLVFFSCYLIIARNASSFGWSVFYYPSFLKQLNLSYHYQPLFHFRDYFTLAYSHLVTGLLASNLVLFLFLLLLVFFPFPSFRFYNFNFDQMIAMTILVIFIVRFIFQPAIADRFYIAYYLCILVLLVRKQAGSTHSRNSLRE